MEFLGIGPLELLLILVIALIVLGPNEMVKAGATVGNFIRKVRYSDTWQGFQRMSRSLRTLPEDFARQTGIDEIRKEITGSVNIDNHEASPKNNDTEQMLEAWTQAPKVTPTALDEGESRSKEEQSPARIEDQEN